ALVSPNSAMSSQLSAPQITAHRAIATIDNRGCSLVRSTRGSSSMAKCSLSATSTDASAIHLLQPTNGPKLTSIPTPRHLDASTLLEGYGLTHGDNRIRSQVSNLPRPGEVVLGGTSASPNLPRVQL